MSKTPLDSPYCLYSFFLFSQLYNEMIKPKYEFDPMCQILYRDICNEFGKYCDSEFNDDTIKEYYCIVDYLKSIDTK